MCHGGAVRNGRSRSRVGKPRGFTLVELLVVVGIVAVLMALLMPAVQSAREAARMAQCRNNLAQIAKGFAAHEQSQGTYPSGGWSLLWAGDADRGFGPSQPGGWIYSLLPFVEQKQLWDLPGDGQPDAITTVQKNKALQLVTTPLPLLHCPSRRPAQLYPSTWAAYVNITWNAMNGLSLNNLAHTDYCASAGSRDVVVGSSGPQQADFPPEPPADSPRWFTSPGGEPNPNGFPATKQFTGDGIVFQRSGIRAAHVRDGLTYTIVAGEKYINAGQYLTGLDQSDNESAYTGDDRDTLCSCNGLATNAPRQDSIRWASRYFFGSPHSQGCNYAFGDGSVRTVAYDVDIEMMRRMVVRNDRLPVEVEP
jgi:prepilin-type N-terminal cleavage/methylation domain-containing protein/prepilin-type processing-associated H-X9-DG protein